MHGADLPTPRKDRPSCLPPAAACLLLAFCFTAGSIVALQAERAAPRHRARLSSPQQPPLAAPPDYTALAPPAPPPGARPASWADHPDEPEHRNRPLPAPVEPQAGAEGAAGAAAEAAAGAAGGSVRVPSLEPGSDAALRLYTDDVRRMVAMCRFPQACVDTRGTLYVPMAFKRFRSAIASKCALAPADLLFYDPKTDADVLEWTVTRHHPDTHIAGRQPLRFHMPHLVEDMLRTTFGMARFLQRETTAPWKVSSTPFNPTNTSVYCYEPTTLPFAPRPYVCGSNPPAVTNVLVLERAALNGWAAGLFRLLQHNSSKTPMQIMYTDEAFPPEPSMDKMQKKHDAFLRQKSHGRQTLFKPRRACFGSISVPGLRQVKTSPFPEGEDNVLLKHLGIQREFPTLHASVTCRLNVTILNRPAMQQTSANDPRSGDRRRITNIKDVRAALLKEASRLEISINLVEREDFADIPFSAQVQTMQHTHSLISVHGAELSNTLFMRRGGTVVEVYPFRYTPTVFTSLINICGLKHKIFIADPDIRSYKKCILHFNGPNDSEREAAERAIERFEFRAATFLKAKSAGSSQALGAHWDAGHAVKSSRACGRAQRLVVDPAIVARQALKDYARLCYGSQDSSSINRKTNIVK